MKSFVLYLFFVLVISTFTTIMGGMGEFNLFIALSSLTFWAAMFAPFLESKK